MRSPFRTPLVLLLACVLPAALTAQGGASWSACKTDSLSTFNCASYYSGTVTMTSELKAPNLDERQAITATVTAGRVSCKVKPAEGPEFTGAGMVAVEHDNNANAGGHGISVWCPEEPGAKVGRGTAASIEVMHQESANYATLEGKEAYDHPDSDEVNGVSGKMTVTWRLERR